MKNPFRGLRFSLLDFHAARTSLGAKIAMLGIALIPLIYGALYLMGFYDPYGNLGSIPVVVVNEDKPAYSTGGERVNVGAELVDELKESDSLGYNFVDSDEVAQAGLEDGTYYSKIVIPEDFSAKIASADSDDPEQASLVLVTNDANNYLSSILSASVMRVVTSKLNYTVSDNYYVQIFEQIEDTGSSLQDAADGAQELEDGLGDAEDGSQQITDGLKSAKSGAKELGDGIKSAKDGSNTITVKLGDARDGAQQLADGTVTAADGSATITSNLKTAADGAQTLDSGLSNAKDGSATITTNLKTAADGAATLDNGIASLADGLKSGNVGAAQLYAGLKTLEVGTSKLAAGAKSLQTTLTEDVHSDGVPVTYYAGVSDLASGISYLNAQVGQIPDMTAVQRQVYGMQSQVGQMSATIYELSAGAQALADGPAKDLEAHAQTAQSSASQITAALTSAEPTLNGVGDNIKAAAGSIAASEVALGSALTTLSEHEKSDDGSVTLSASELATLVGTIQTGLSKEQEAATFNEQGGLASGSLATAGGTLSALGATLSGMSDVQTNLVVALQGTDGNGGVKGDLTTISASVGQMMGKSSGMISGATSMLEGASGLLGQLGGTLSALPALKSGTAQLNSGAQSLKAQLEGGGELNAGITALSSGAASADEGLVKEVLPGMESLASGINQLADGAAQAKDGSASLAGGLTQLADGSATLTDGLNTAETGAAALKGGLGQLYAGSETLTSGLVTAKTGSASLTSGLSQLQTGSATLTKGLGTAYTGSGSLSSGINKLYDGSSELTEGLVSAKDGSKELADGLSDGVDSVKEATEGADAKAEMMSEPIALEEENYTYVENYGTGFAPYFIALGLWVGALVMTFLFEPFNKRLIASGASPAVAAFSGLVPWLLLGTVQALLIGLTIQFPCGIDVLHPAAYYPLVVLTAVAFCAMIQALIAVFGFPGKFVAVVLLMLQLTTAAGTFPIQTEFPIFQALSPYLPMTYSVHALRIAMRGLDLGLVGHDVAMLLVFTGVSFVVTCLVARRKRVITMMDLHPLVDL